MNEGILLSKAKFYSRVLWGIEYNGTVEIKRMGNICGRFWESNIPLIEIGQKLVESKNDYYIDDILLHELTHWYCKLIGEDYRDGKPDFENRLRENGIGSTRRGLTIGKQGVFATEFVDGELIYVPYQPSEKILELNQRYHMEIK